MGRRLRATAPAKTAKRKPAPVTSYSHWPGRGWSLPQAADLLRQGYTVEQAARLTGYFPTHIMGWYTRHGGLL